MVDNQIDKSTNTSVTGLKKVLTVPPFVTFSLLSEFPDLSIAVWVSLGDKSHWPLISFYLRIFEQHQVPFLDIGLTILPLASTLKSREMFSPPSLPKCILQVLDAFPLLTIHICSLKLSWRRKRGADLLCQDHRWSQKKQ